MNSTRHTGGVPFFSHYSYLFCSFDEGLFTLYEKAPLLLLALNSFEKGAMSNQVIASFSKPRRILQSKELDIFIPREAYHISTLSFRIIYFFFLARSKKKI